MHVGTKLRLRCMRVYPWQPRSSQSAKSSGAAICVGSTLPSTTGGGGGVVFHGVHVGAALLRAHRPVDRGLGGGLGLRCFGRAGSGSGSASASSAAGGGRCFRVRRGSRRGLVDVAGRRGSRGLGGCIELSLRALGMLVLLLAAAQPVKGLPPQRPPERRLSRNDASVPCRDLHSVSRICRGPQPAAQAGGAALYSRNYNTPGRGVQECSAKNCSCAPYRHIWGAVIRGGFMV